MISMVYYLTFAGHLVGVAGCLVCLVLFYWQLVRLFAAKGDSRSNFRLTRLLVLVQRFLWVAWLSGVSIYMSRYLETGLWLQSPLMADKLVLLFLLSLSTIGLDRLRVRWLLAREGHEKIFDSVAVSVVLRVSVALSTSSVCTAGYMVYCMATGHYSHGQAVLILLRSFCVILALVIVFNDQWIEQRPTAGRQQRQAS